MGDLFVLAIIALILGLAGGYVYRSVKAGKTCIGCPDSGNCSKHSRCSGCSGCGGSCSADKNG